MSYAVDWTPEARSQLAAVWLQSVRRPAVTAAQAKIDILLASDPFASSVHVSEGLYGIEVYPLWAQLEVSAGDRSVTVVSVRELL
jgi:hypothetical protein